MASLTKGRPSRRAASRRSYAVEETSESEISGNETPTATHDDDDEEEQDYTPVPKQARRPSKRLALDPTTPPTVRPARKSRPSVAEESDVSQSTDNDENETGEEEDDDDDVSMASAEADPESPSGKPRLKRKSTEAVEADPDSPSSQAALKKHTPAPEEPAEPKPRMIIQNLVLVNFKSYAGKQVVGPFHASFSSVVGPNGSGKSNVIDSLLFVFGFRASKMRQGKISALIHNSAQYPDLPYCEVEVHFAQVLDLPDGGHEVIPDSQLKETNFTAVTTFLRDRGIDLDHKRFLILQGEVESIAQMKAKATNEHDEGLLEYLEDIIGTSKYKTPIDEAAAELETLNDVCVEKNNRVQHVEKEKTALEDKKNKALAYIRDENELAEKQSALYQIYIDECADNVRVTEEAILQMQELLNMELEKHEGNEAGIKEIEKAYKRGVREYESMEKQTKELLKEMAKYDKEGVKFEEKKKFLLGKQKKLEKTMQTSRLAASECQSLVQKFTDDIEKKTAETAQLEKEMKAEEAELNTIREGLKGKTEGLSEQIAIKQKSLEPWNEKINKKQSAVAVAQSELDILRERSNAGAVQLEEAQGKIAAIQETLQMKQTNLEERQAQKETLEGELAKLQHDLKKYAAREPEIRTHVSSARQKADEARNSLASTQNRGSVLTGLMRLKESGRIDGFHGRFGQPRHHRREI
ncbi:Nuclear condensin complex subunit Smc4 [Penicillium chermesinum]|nr:Nuclear condensin complex subunit Smc4 [Penicillium chermesinum]